MTTMAPNNFFLINTLCHKKFLPLFLQMGGCSKQFVLFSLLHLCTVGLDLYFLLLVMSFSPSSPHSSAFPSWLYLQTADNPWQWICPAISLSSCMNHAPTVIPAGSPAPEALILFLVEFVLWGWSCTWCSPYGKLELSNSFFISFQNINEHLAGLH